jgi:hypothetical protein
VVEDALDPLAADRALRAVGQNGGVLHRDRDLVVEAVRHPALQLFAGELALGHHHVEGVVDVVARALLAQQGLELAGLHGGRSSARATSAAVCSMLVWSM